MRRWSHHRVTSTSQKGEVSISGEGGFRSNFLRAWDRENGAYFQKGTYLKFWGDDYFRIHVPLEQDLGGKKEV